MIEQAVLGDALLQGAKEVFETMVFMDMEKSSELDSTLGHSALLGSITFKGDMEGSLGFCCNLSCAHAIAINMLGIDAAEEINEGEICDALGEVVNMIMGCFKSQVADTVGNMEVSIPTVVSGCELKNNLGEGALKILIKVNIADEYTAELSLLHRASLEALSNRQGAKE